jgi:hypothetical protein
MAVEPAAPSDGLETTSGTDTLRPADPVPPEEKHLDLAREDPHPNGHARPAAAPRRRPWLRPVLIFAEAVTATVPAVLFVAWSKNIDVDPLTRIGQVSGLAALQLRFAIISIVLVAALVLIHRFGTEAVREAATRIGCALVAGLATALAAGGTAVAVRHTPWALWANLGDNHWILDWTHRMLDGNDVPDYYPPMSMWALVEWSRVSGKPPEYALQDIQLFGSALFGPAAYLAWRLTLRPVWALAIGVTASLPFFEPVKPYAQITLVMLIPVLVKFLHELRYAGRLRWWRVVVLGLIFGAGIGLLFLLYSGWFVWTAAGILVAALVVMPWRGGLARGAVLCGVTLATTVAVSWVHLRGLLDSSGGTSDRYFYFDTNTEPTYFAMWRNDRAVGAGPVWPPLGELGGVGVFTLLLAAGAGVAIWFGWRRTVVLALGCFAASAWVMRMWLASEQYSTMTVRLYPRTTMVLLYCVLLLTGFGVRHAVTWLRERPGRQPLRLAPVGLLLVPLLFVFASAGSATADKYMPPETLESRGTFGFFTYMAQHTPLLEGGCPQYGRQHGGCTPELAIPKY